MHQQICELGMPNRILKDIELLREKIRRYDYQYYVLSQPEIADGEYDALVRSLKSLEDVHPEYKTDDSPTSRVGGGVLKGFKTIGHKEPMLSLDNTYSFDELRSWEERVRKGLKGIEHVAYVAELKIDGLSVTIAYEGGRLQTGATRGDGRVGEDVTLNLKTIRSVPLRLLGRDIPDYIEVRGEVYIEKKEFVLLNRQREESGEPFFANPRNAASGSLKLLDTALTAERNLNFFAHSLGRCLGFDCKSQSEYFAMLKVWGVRTNPYSQVCRDLNQVIDFCRLWQSKRDSVPYEIDGIVIKVDSIEFQKQLGMTSKSPRWAVAYKFPARQATTRIVKIDLHVGRTGVITPAAELEPVECSGVIIRNATLHNFDEIKRLGVKEGDRVLIERAGDVIPKIVKVVEAQKGGVLRPPKVCPACQGKILKEKDGEVAYRCVNSFCPAQIERGLFHFGSRDCMDIEGLGESAISQLVKSGLVRKSSDLFVLTKDDLLTLDLFKDKKADNLLRAISASKQKPLSRLLFALGIRHIGEKAAGIVARHFKDIDRVSAACLKDFDGIYEIGPVMANSIVDYFSQPATKQLIADFKTAGLSLREEAVVVRQTPLTGKTVVFTGELMSFSRAQAQELVRWAGGAVSGSVSKETDFVVAGDKPGSKLAKARQLGVKSIDEVLFKEMIR